MRGLGKVCFGFCWKNCTVFGPSEMKLVLHGVQYLGEAQVHFARQVLWFGCGCMYLYIFLHLQCECLYMSTLNLLLLLLVLLQLLNCEPHTALALPGFNRECQI